MLSQFVLLPLYIYPSPTNWQNIYTAAAKYPDLTFSVVINPSDGPGSGKCPSSDWITGISTLNSFKNTQLLGYVHTTEATRPIADVMADIDKYAAWPSKCGKADIHMSGIFFDESPATCDSSTCPYMGNATAHVTAKLGAGKDYTVFNAGVHSDVLIDAGLYALADTIIVFEDYYSNYSPAKVTAIPSAFRKQSAFIIHDFNGNTKALGSTVNTIVGDGALGLHITSDSDYDTWGSIWSQFVKDMSTAIVNSNLKSTSATGATSSTGVAGTKRNAGMLSRIFGRRSTVSESTVSKEEDTLS